MATTTAEIVDIGKGIADCAKGLASTNKLIIETLERNTGEAFDWGGADAATANTALTGAGLWYTAAEVSNAIGSLAAFQTFWATHGGNLRKLTKTIN
jgi:hypothetical protein